MLKRVIFEDWTTVVPIISFAVTLIVFIGFFVRTVRMDKDTISRSAGLALQKDDQNESEGNNE